MAKRKVRKEVKIVGAVLALALLVVLAIKLFSKPAKNDGTDVADNKTQEETKDPKNQEAEENLVIEGDGDITIIIDEDEESEGF